jgi:glycosyltransferase involved in cell wall biosynthesis
VRVLLITDWLRPVGGAERYIVAVREGLRAAGDEVRLLTSDVGTAGDGTAEYQAHGSEMLVAKAVLQLANPFAYAALRRAVREFEPEVALVNMFEHQLSPAIFPALRRVPTVLSVTDYKGICPVSSKLLPDDRLCQSPAGLVCWRSGCLTGPHWARDQARYALIRRGRNSTERVITCSEWMRRELGRHGIEAEHVAPPVPPPGPMFQRRAAGQPTLVYCGRLDRTKGLPLLLRAFARLRRTVPAARLRIVGEGPLLETLEDQVRRMELEPAVTFRGMIPPERVEDELTDAWAVIVPSLWAEPLGLVAIEAILRGIPVVASAAGGLGETVEHGVSGLLFGNGDEDALAGHLDEVASARAFPTHTVPETAVRRLAQRHRPDLHTERLRAILTALVAARASTRPATRPPEHAL